MVVNPQYLKNAAEFYEQNGEYERAAAQRRSNDTADHARRHPRKDQYSTSALIVAAIAGAVFALYAAYVYR